MAEDNGITGISLNGVRKLIEDRSLPEDILDIFGKISGVVMALSPLIGGATAGILWPLLEPKDALVDAAKAAIRRITRSQPSDYIAQARRFAAGNTLLTFTAYFDALRICESELMAALGLSKEGKHRIASEAAAHARGLPPLGDSSPMTAQIFKVPYPANPHDPASAEARRQIYIAMGQCILNGADVEGCMANKAFRSEKVAQVLGERVPTTAEAVYQAEFLGMAIDYQPFFVWSALQDRADKGALLRELTDSLRAAGEDSQLRFELLGAALYKLDLGLDRLSRAIAAQPSPSPDGPRHPDSAAARAAEALRRRYAADVERPVIDDRYDLPAAGPRLIYPGSAAAYIPQAYRQVRYVAGETHLERDEEWRQLPAADDLGPALIRYLESAYSTESPLLILGHPGSGKSLLTRVYAARLQYPRYTVVRVELRDANPAVSIQKQVEDQIRKDTGYDVNWADLAGNLPLSPPVVILDGYDELLQATGRLFTDYLDQVQRFQRDGLIQDRPVRVIVTSRITLIDKAIIPSGAAVMRLEPFDEPRRAEWIARWNMCNADYFQEADLNPFTLPANEKLAELAEQPLLLLMLAIFDSADNALSSRPDLDQTLLYDELLRRFIERELGKGEHGSVFSGLRPAERRPLVDRELTRLGVAAIGMFNRQDVKILRDQLDRDLAFFAAERPLASGLYGQSQSELLLGSFFFIHESRSRLPADGAADGPQLAASSANAPAAGPAAFEFLHNTFGEFLAADFILEHVISNAATIRDLASRPTLEHARQQHLASLTPYWFASLLYTPLHTRPNILALLRAWSFHRMPTDPAARAELLSCVDEIIRTQLRALLAGTGPLDLSGRVRNPTPGESAPVPPPYDPLPVLGHVAVYTLNLILLRTYLSQQHCTLDEPALDAGDRPWDRLTALWRSWFTPESLGTLATQFTATRTGTRLTLEPTRSALTITASSPLNIAYNAATALADNLTAASTGLHVVSLNVVEENFVKALLENISKTGDLGAIADVMRLRAYGSDPSYVANYTLFDVLTYVNPRGPELMVRVAELIERTSIASGRSQGMEVPAADMKRMVNLSRYHAELLVHACTRFDPQWLEGFLPDQTFRPNPPQQTIPAIYSAFLMSAAAAPVLRAAVQRLSADQCTGLAGTIMDRLAGHETKLFDVDTAAALAVLGRRGSITELCLRAIDAILQECQHGTWRLSDIPLDTWASLVDALLTADPAIQSRRQPLAAILDGQLEDLGPVSLARLDRTDDQFIEFWLHALRISKPADLTPFMYELVRLVTSEYADYSAARRRILLLFRWAHDYDEPRIRGLLSNAARPWWTYFGPSDAAGPAAIDFDRASADLTYREAMDLRWALNSWRESGADWPGEPTSQPAPEPAGRRSRPSRNRRRSRH